MLYGNINDLFGRFPGHVKTLQDLSVHRVQTGSVYPDEVVCRHAGLDVRMNGIDRTSSGYYYFISLIMTFSDGFQGTFFNGRLASHYQSVINVKR